MENRKVDFDKAVKLALLALIAIFMTLVVIGIFRPAAKAGGGMAMPSRGGVGAVAGVAGSGRPAGSGGQGVMSAGSGSQSASPAVPGRAQSAEGSSAAPASGAEDRRAAAGQDLAGQVAPATGRTRPAAETGTGDRAAGFAANGGGSAPTGGAAPGAKGAVSAGQGALPTGAGGNGSVAAGSVAANAVTVSVADLAPASISRTIRLNGDVVSRSEISVFPDTSGKLVKYEVGVGARVAKGDIIARIDPSKPGSAYTESPVRSPIEGTVISLPFVPGQTVSVSSGIAVVGSLDNLQIVTFVPEKYVAVLRAGLPASVTLAPYPDSRLAAAVTQVSPVIDPTSRTVELRLSVRDPDSLLKSGMFAVITLVTQSRSGAMVVPNSAIRDYNADKVVYAVDGEGIARRRIVVPGLSNDTETELLSGVAFGERVIVSGSVSEGTPVRIAASGGAQ